MANAQYKTIKEIFDFGFEEMEQQNCIVNDNKYLYHIEDFVKGGKMEKFFGYTVNRFEDEFCCCLSFR